MSDLEMLGEQFRAEPGKTAADFLRQDGSRQQMDRAGVDDR
jgi:hypothetical protein